MTNSTKELNTDNEELKHSLLTDDITLLLANLYPVKSS